MLLVFCLPSLSSPFTCLGVSFSLHTTQAENMVASHATKWSTSAVQTWCRRLGGFLGSQWSSVQTRRWQELNRDNIERWRQQQKDGLTQQQEARAAHRQHAFALVLFISRLLPEVTAHSGAGSPHPELILPIRPASIGPLLIQDPIKLQPRPVVLNLPKAVTL